MVNYPNLNYLNFFRSFDYFGVPQNLLVNNSQKYTSIFGGCMFFLYSILGIIYFLFEFAEFLKKTNYIVSSSIKITSPSPNMNFKEQNFYLAFGIQFASNFTYADEATDNFFDHTIEYRILNNGVVTIKKFPMRKCLKEDLYYVDNETIERNNLLKYYCLSDNNLTIGGSFSDKNFQFVRYNLAFKKDILQKYSKEYLENYILKNKLRSTIFCSDNAIKADNYENPLQVFMNDYSTLIDYNFSKGLVMEYILFSFLDDKNFFLNNPVETNHIKLYYGREYFVTNPKTSEFEITANPLVFYNFQSNPNSSIIMRSYTKFPAFLANVTAILSNGLIFIAISVTVVNEFKLNQTIINKIVEFKERLHANDELMNKFNEISNIIKEKNIKKSTDVPGEIKLEFSKSKKIENNNGESGNSKSDNILRKKTIINGFKRIKKQQGQAIDFNYFEILSFSFLCCKSRQGKVKHAFYNVGKDNIFYNLDLITIIKKLQELDIIKSILFSNEEQNLITFLSKSVISIGEEKKLINDYNDNNSNKKFLNSDSQISSIELDLIYKSYETIIRNNNRNTLQDIFNERYETLIRNNNRSKLIDIFNERILKICDDQSNNCI